MSAALQDLDFAFRPMREVDVPSVTLVEKAAYPYPWTEGIFRDCLRVGYSCWVLVVPKDIVGYGVMSVAAGECHILNLTVHPRAQRQGFGRKILRRLLAVGRSRDADTAFLEVRASNRSARALYALEGFCETGKRRGYYPLAEGREDAVIMARSLEYDRAQHVAPPRRLPREPR
ncbi:MAG: ribosomal protein S18-alanine N-acetyltransferase [Chromatiaceae bacterium]|nr:ribosomal protein S18-alanine N-acetyltransferase [Chromatiaceae bacterium]